MSDRRLPGKQPVVPAGMARAAQGGRGCVSSSQDSLPDRLLVVFQPGLFSCGRARRNARRKPDGALRVYRPERFEPYTGSRSAILESATRTDSAVEFEDS